MNTSSQYPQFITPVRQAENPRCCAQLLRNEIDNVKKRV